MAKPSYDAPAVRYAVQMIEMLGDSDKPLGVAEICKALDLNNNMVFFCIHRDSVAKGVYVVLVFQVLKQVAERQPVPEAEEVLKPQLGPEVT